MRSKVNDAIVTEAALSEERVVSSFPDPPASLYKLYTDENVRSGKAPKPPAPIKGKYHDVSISIKCSTIVLNVCSLLQTEDAMIWPLEEQGLERLCSPNYGLCTTFPTHLSSMCVYVPYGCITRPVMQPAAG